MFGESVFTAAKGRWWHVEVLLIRFCYGNAGGRLVKVRGVRLHLRQKLVGTLWMFLESVYTHDPQCVWDACRGLESLF